MSIQEDLRSKREAFIARLSARSAVAEEQPPAEEQPAASASSAPVEEQPAASASSAPVEEQPAASASSAPVEEQPAASASSAPVMNVTINVVAPSGDALGNLLTSFLAQLQGKRQAGGLTAIEAPPCKKSALPDDMVALPSESAALPDDLVALPSESAAEPSTTAALPSDLVAVASETAAEPTGDVVDPDNYVDLTRSPSPNLDFSFLRDQTDDEDEDDPDFMPRGALGPILPRQADNPPRLAANGLQGVLDRYRHGAPRAAAAAAAAAAPPMPLPAPVVNPAPVVVPAPVVAPAPEPAPQPEPVAHGMHCSVCLSNPFGGILRCHHMFCIPCLQELKRLKRPCPMCRKPFRKWQQVFG